MIFRNYQIYFPTDNSADINYLKRQGLICKSTLIFLFRELFLVHGPVDRVHGTMVHGCMRYIKLRPSKSGSTVGILNTEGLSQDLIMTVRVGFDGVRLSDEKEWWCALCSWRRHGHAA
jgi:hypothetical protein